MEVKGRGGGELGWGEVGGNWGAGMGGGWGDPGGLGQGRTWVSLWEFGGGGGMGVKFGGSQGMLCPHRGGQVRAEVEGSWEQV